MIRQLFEQRSLRPAANDARRSILGARSITGAVVTPKTAMQVMAVYGCVRILAETVASLPLILYQRQSTRGKKRAIDHPLYTLLHDVPNPEMSNVDFWEAMVGQVALRGNAYAEIEFDQGGRVMGLWPLRADRMEVRRNRQGALVYQYTLPERFNNRQVEMPAFKILHLRGLSSNGLVGYSPVTLARQALGLALATEEHGARFFGNGARPGIILEHPGMLSDKARDNLAASWNDRHMGLSNANRVAVLEEGLTAHEIKLSNEDAQFLSTRKFQLAEIARMYRMPLALLQEHDKAATYASVEQFMLSFVVHTIRPWLVRIEKSIWRSLLLPRERKQYFAEFLVDGLLRGDLATRYKAYALGRQWGWFSVNDILELENRNPVPGGDVRLTPMNMMPLSGGRTLPHDTPLMQQQFRRMPAVEHRAANRRRSVQQSYQLPLQDALRRILRREAQDVGQAMRKMLQSEGKQAFLDWLDGYYRDRQLPSIERDLAAVMEGFGTAVLDAVQAELDDSNIGIHDGWRSWITAYIHNYTARHHGKSMQQIERAIQKAQDENNPPEDTLQTQFEQWRTQRPGDVAMGESVRFSNALSVAQYAAVGVSTLVWVSFGQSCPYCQSLDGRTVGLNEIFLPVGKFQPDGADGPLTVTHEVKHAPAHQGCDCQVMAVL